LGAETAVATVEDFVRGDGGDGCPLVVEATNSPHGFRDAVLASRIGGRVVLAGIPDGDTYTLPAADARRRGLTLKFVRRMGDDYPRAIRLVSSGQVNVKAVVTHREGLKKAPEQFENLAAGGAPEAKGRSRYASGQIPPSRTKASPSRTKKTGLDFLGFVRPIRGFSMGYEQSKQKKPRLAAAPPRGAHRACRSSPRPSGERRREFLGDDGR